MTLVNDLYELSLGTSGKLKLRATARMAEGGPDAMFDACVLLHEAARLERRAIEAVPRCPPATRLAASIEECWCLLEGRDPPRAADAWGRVLREKDHVDEATANAMLDRLRPRLEETMRSFQRVLAAHADLLRFKGGALAIPPTAAAQRAVHRAVMRTLDVFPGATSFSWASYRLLDARGDRKGAWEALARARLLDPENRRFEAMSLLLAARALPEGPADEHLGRVRGSLDEAGAEVCLMYALAELSLAERSRPAERWRRALDAANAGLAQARTEGLRKNLKATQLLLAALVAGKQPTLDVLFLAGLGEPAAVAEPSKSVVEIVTSLASQRVGTGAALDEAA